MLCIIKGRMTQLYPSPFPDSCPCICPLTSLHVSMFTALLLRRKYLLSRCALACERLRCEPWRPWGWGGTTRGLRRPARRGVGH